MAAYIGKIVSATLGPPRTSEFPTWDALPSSSGGLETRKSAFARVRSDTTPISPFRRLDCLACNHPQGVCQTWVCLSPGFPGSLGNTRTHAIIDALCAMLRHRAPNRNRSIPGILPDRSQKVTDQFKVNRSVVKKTGQSHVDLCEGSDV